MPQYRTGFPRTCPDWTRICLGRPIASEACACCDLRRIDERGHWRCDHPGYQQARGVHFCPGCGRELGPYAEAHHWQFCGGPQGRCLSADVVMME